MNDNASQTITVLGSIIIKWEIPLYFDQLLQTEMENASDLNEVVIRKCP